MSLVIIKYGDSPETSNAWWKHAASVITLCYTEQRVASPPTPDTSESDTEGTNAIQPVTKRQTPRKGPATLLQIVPVTICGPNGSEENTYAFLDSGSTATILTDELASTLGLSGRNAKTRFQVFNGGNPIIPGRIVQLKMCSRDRSVMINVKRAYTVPHLNIVHHTYDFNALQEQHRHLAGLNIPPIDSTKVKLLVGADFLAAYNRVETRFPKPGSGGPAALLIFRPNQLNLRGCTRISHGARSSIHVVEE